MSENMKIEDVLKSNKDENNKNGCRTAIFRDNYGDFYIIKIHFIPNVLLALKCQNLKGEDAGYMNIYVHENNRLYLDVIYCYDKFRKRGIASNINELADYILQIYDGYLLRGEYEPSQLSTDRENQITRDADELRLSANNFYISNGYSIIGYEDYKNNPDKFESINQEDFQLCEELAEYIVAKRIRQKHKYPFIIKNGVLFNENVFIKQALEEKSKYNKL